MNNYPLWKESLLNYFKGGIKENRQGKLGVELEHFIVRLGSKEAVPYAGIGGVREILTKLMARYPGAKALIREDLIGFSTPNFTITLEPAAQIEISIAPRLSVLRIGEIYSHFRQNLQEELSPREYEVLTVGCQPTSNVENIRLIPKERYRLMDRHFAHTGNGGREMMRGTASLQVSVDYYSEEDFRQKIQAAYYYSPILKILTDNSTAFEGKPLQGFLKRTDIWRRVDKTRTGIVPDIFKADFGFSDYASFIGSMPPIFLPDGEGYRTTGDRTVASLYENDPMDEKAMEHIISMAFPDVRLKNYLELRMADSVPLNIMLAYVALIKGLLYSDEGLVYAKDRIMRNKLSEKDILAAEDNLMTKGYKAQIYGEPLCHAAEDAITIAKGNLPPDERILLEPFEEKIRTSI